ncbi:MAG: VWA domain-containing protein, partial [Candidatus Helarchaeota archaeon]
GNWVIGDSPHELLYEDTIRIYGRVIPPVFSFKYSSYKKPDDSGSLGGNVCLVLDVSGSMGGKPIERLKEAAYSIIESAKKFNDIVSVIPFNHTIEDYCIIKPGRDYNKAEDIVARLIDGGGTQITEAIKKALEFAEEKGTQTTYIITDTEIGDLKKAKNYLKKLKSYGKTILFVIGSNIHSKYLSQLADKVYILSDASKPFTEEALIEYYGDKYGIK